MPTRTHKRQEPRKAGPLGGGRRQRRGAFASPRILLRGSAGKGFAEVGGDPSLGAEQRERRDAVQCACRHSPPEQREVLVLKEFEGLKFREIADILDCPESTVKSRMYYGLNGLKSALVREGIT